MSKAIEAKEQYLAKLEAITADRTKLINDKVNAYREALELSTPFDNAEVDKIKKIIAALDEVIIAEEEAAKKLEELMNPQPVEEPIQEEVKIEEPIQEEVKIEEPIQEEVIEQPVVEEVVEEAPAVAEDATPIEEEIKPQEIFQEEVIQVLNVDRPVVVMNSRDEERR